MDQFFRALESTDPWLADYSLSAIVLGLLLSFVLGQVLAWTYVWTHSGLSYSRSFTQSLVMMTMVVSLVMSIIGNSIVTAFGLLGALALIRFRNVLKDTRDTVFVFLSLVVGMAVGTQRYTIAILGTSAMLLVVVYLNFTSFGTMGRFDGYLTLRLGPAGPGGPDHGPLLRKFCRSIKRVSRRQSGEADTAEVVYQVGLRDRNRTHDLLQALEGLDEVSHASLVVRDELSEV